MSFGMAGMDDFSAWIGRTEERTDRLDPARSSALHAALGDPMEMKVGERLPALHHWLHFWDVGRRRRRGRTAIRRRGGFLPPMALDAACGPAAG